jgi:hypothetical protein
VGGVPQRVARRSARRPSTRPPSPPVPPRRSRSERHRPVTLVRRADVCAVAIADAFRGDGEILANPIGTIPMIGGRLARATFEPDLVMTDGEAALIGQRPMPRGVGRPRRLVETWNPTGDVRRRLERSPPRDDGRHPGRPVRQPEHRGASATADRPKTQLLGFRGAPGNTINHTTSYWVPSTGPACSSSTSTWSRASATTGRRRSGASASRFHEIRRVISNLGVFDFETPDHRMRLRSRAPRRDRRRGGRGHGLRAGRSPTRCPSPALPTPEELRAPRRGDRPGRHPLPRGAGPGVNGRLVHPRWLARHRFPPRLRPVPLTSGPDGE